MKTLSILGIIIVMGIGVIIWQNSLKQTNDALSNAIRQGLPQNVVTSVNANLGNIVKNIKVPLTKLDLSNQGLTKVPMDTFDQLASQELDLSNNRLTGAIPSQIGQLKNLEVLNLSNNLMTGVPAEVGQLGRLRILDLSNNKLTGLPNELGNLDKLEILNLSGNNYSTQDLEVIKKGLPADVQIIY